MQAVALVLLGHAARGVVRRLGTPALAQAALTGIGAQELAGRTALLHAATGGLLMAFFLRTPRSGRPAADEGSG